MFKSPLLRSYGLWHWGEGLQTVLFTWYMIFHAQLSASEIGFYQSLVLAPFLLVTVAGGAWTDKIGARTSYSISTALFATVLIGYGLVDWFWGFVPLLFFVYCVLAGIASAISNPAIDTFIPEMGGGSAQSNSLQAASAHNLAKLTGNITGLALPLFSAVGGFVCNGLLMLASVLFLRHHQSPSSVGNAQSTTQKHKNSIDRAIAHYRACPENFDLLLSSGMLGLLLISAGYILWPLVMRERFPDHGNLIAWINISSWIGAIAAALYFKRVSTRIHRPGLLALSAWSAAAVIGLSMIFVQNFIVFCAIKLLLGMCYVGKPLVYGRYLLNTPKADRGLLVAIDQTAFWGMATLGTFCMGHLVERYGIEACIIGNAALVMCCVLLLCTAAVRARKHSPDRQLCRKRWPHRLSLALPCAALSISRCSTWPLFLTHCPASHPYSMSQRQTEHTCTSYSAISRASSSPTPAKSPPPRPGACGLSAGTIPRVSGRGLLCLAS